MATPQQIIDIYSGFDSVEAFDDAMSDYEVQQDVLDINRDQMRLRGEDANGKRIRPLYSKAYRKTKKDSKTSPTPDLYKSGDMHKEMMLEKTSKGEYAISSPTPYTEHLYKRYGQFFGIAKKNTSRFKKVMLSPISQSIRKRLKL